MQIFEFPEQCEKKLKAFEIEMTVLSKRKKTTHSYVPAHNNKHSKE